MPEVKERYHLWCSLFFFLIENKTKTEKNIVISVLIANSLYITAICLMQPICFWPSETHCLSRQSILNDHLSYAATNYLYLLITTQTPPYLPDMSILWSRWESTAGMLQNLISGSVISPVGMETRQQTQCQADGLPVVKAALVFCVQAEN
jgi:hypothetical protein